MDELADSLDTSTSAGSTKDKGTAPLSGRGPVSPVETASRKPAKPPSATIDNKTNKKVPSNISPMALRDSKGNLAHTSIGPPHPPPSQNIFQRAMSGLGAVMGYPQGLVSAAALPVHEALGTYRGQLKPSPGGARRDQETVDALLKQNLLQRAASLTGQNPIDPLMARPMQGNLRDTADAAQFGVGDVLMRRGTQIATDPVSLAFSPALNVLPRAARIAVMGGITSQAAAAAAEKLTKAHATGDRSLVADAAIDVGMAAFGALHLARDGAGVRTDLVAKALRAKIKEQQAAGNPVNAMTLARLSRRYNVPLKDITPPSAQTAKARLQRAARPVTKEDSPQEPATTANAVPRAAPKTPTTPPAAHTSAAVPKKAAKPIPKPTEANKPPEPTTEPASSSTTKAAQPSEAQTRPTVPPDQNNLTEPIVGAKPASANPPMQASRVRVSDGMAFVPDGKGGETSVALPRNAKERGWAILELQEIYDRAAPANQKPGSPQREEGLTGLSNADAPKAEPAPSTKDAPPAVGKIAKPASVHPSLQGSKVRVAQGKAFVPDGKGGETAVDLPLNAKERTGAIRKLQAIHDAVPARSADVSVLPVQPDPSATAPSPAGRPRASSPSKPLNIKDRFGASHRRETVRAAEVAQKQGAVFTERSFQEFADRFEAAGKGKFGKAKVEAERKVIGTEVGATRPHPRSTDAPATKPTVGKESSKSEQTKTESQPTSQKAAPGKKAQAGQSVPKAKTEVAKPAASGKADVEIPDGQEDRIVQSKVGVISSSIKKLSTSDLTKQRGHVSRELVSYPRSVKDLARHASVNYELGIRGEPINEARADDSLLFAQQNLERYEAVDRDDDYLRAKAEVELAKRMQSEYRNSKAKTEASRTIRADVVIPDEPFDAHALLNDPMPDKPTKAKRSKPEVTAKGATTEPAPHAKIHQTGKAVYHVELEQAVQEAHTRLESLERPDAGAANRELRKLEGLGIDTSDAREALEEYKGILRADHDSMEEYREARDEAWENFLQTHGMIDASDATHAAPETKPATEPKQKPPDKPPDKPSGRSPGEPPPGAPVVGGGPTVKGGSGKSAPLSFSALKLPKLGTAKAVIGEIVRQVRNWFDRGGIGIEKHAEKTGNPSLLRAQRKEAGTKGQINAMLYHTIPLIHEAFGGHSGRVQQFFNYLAEGSLRGARQRWDDAYSQVEALPAESLADPKVVGKYIDLLEKLESGRRDADAIDFERDPDDPTTTEDRIVDPANPEDRGRFAPGLARRAKTLLSNGETELMKLLMLGAFHEARTTVGVMADFAPDRVGAGAADFDEYGKRPEVQQAMKYYREGISDPVSSAYEANQGVGSDYLGPLGVYFPLVPVSAEGASVGHGQPAAPRAPFHNVPTSGAKFKRGTAERYDTTSQAVMQRIAYDLKRNNRGALINTLRDIGLARDIPESMNPSDYPEVITVGGDQVPAVVRPWKDSTRVVKDGKVYFTGGKNMLIAKFAAEELNPQLEHSEYEPNTLFSAITNATVAGPTAAVVHNHNLASALVSGTPFVGRGLGKIPGSIPGLKLIAAITHMMSIDPTSPERAADVRMLAEMGMLHPKTGTVTSSKAVSEAHGEDPATGNALVPVRPMSAMLYGMRGTELRARLALLDIARAVAEESGQEATPEDMYNFVSQAGVYAHGLDSKVERVLKKAQLAPFVTAGKTQLGLGARAMIPGAAVVPKGVRPSAKLNLQARAQISSGIIGATGLWFAMFRAYTGRLPGKDDKFNQIPINEKDRKSKMGQMIFGPGDSDVSASLDITNPALARAMHATGVRSIINTVALGKETDPNKIVSNSYKDIMNGLASPVTTSPQLRFLTEATAGVDPYLTGFHSKTGDFGLQFAPSVNEDEPMAAHRLASQWVNAVLNLNPYTQLAGQMATDPWIIQHAPGSVSEPLGLIHRRADREDDAAVTMALKTARDIFFPRAVPFQPPPRPGTKKTDIQKQIEKSFPKPPRGAVRDAARRFGR